MNNFYQKAVDIFGSFTTKKLFDKGIVITGMRKQPGNGIWPYPEPIMYVVNDRGRIRMLTFKQVEQLLE